MTAALHRTLQRQIDKASRHNGVLDTTQLLELVSATYEEADLERRRGDRANRLMAGELSEASERQTQLLEALRLQNTHFEAALDNMSQGLCLFDADHRLVVCNERYVSMFRLPDGIARPGIGLLALLAHSRSFEGSDGGARRRAEAYQRLAASPTRATIHLELADGRSITAAHEPLVDGGFVHTCEDVTARRQAEQKIAHMATHDALTDLPNRMLLQQRMEAALRTRANGECAVLCLDLDRFKPVNDTLGHPVGDEVLKLVAQRLVRQLRGSDTVARIGGDEFAVVLDGVGGRIDADAIAARLVEDVARPYEVNGHQIDIGVSVGIAVAPRDGNDPMQLIKCADMALYRAKSHGRGCFRSFEPEMDLMARARRALEIDLRAAIAGQAFEIHYQPQFNLLPRFVSGFEALLRWNCPSRGPVQPSVFIPLAEELGLIVELGHWVLEHACREAMNWPGDCRLAVNVSPKQFRSGALLQGVDRALQLSGLPAQRLELEITESVLMDHHPQTFETLHQLRDLGVGIVMDDFGTGYSSLGYLSRFPFDKIKIDRSFVHGLGRQTDAIAIVRAVTTLCRSLGIASTAEGVETQEQLRLLSGERCTEVQGFLFSRARPASEIPALIRAFATAQRDVIETDPNSA